MILINNILIPLIILTYSTTGLLHVLTAKIYTEMKINENKLYTILVNGELIIGRLYVIQSIIDNDTTCILIQIIYSPLQNKPLYFKDDINV